MQLNEENWNELGIIQKLMWKVSFAICLLQIYLSYLLKFCCGHCPPSLQLLITLWLFLSSNRSKNYVWRKWLRISTHHILTELKTQWHFWPEQKISASKISASNTVLFVSWFSMLPFVYGSIHWSPIVRNNKAFTKLKLITIKHNYHT